MTPTAYVLASPTIDVPLPGLGAGSSGPDPRDGGRTSGDDDTSPAPDDGPDVTPAITVPPVEDAVHVSPVGNDHADGSIDAPVRTLHRANQLVAPGDTVLMRAGTYDYDTQQDLTASGRAGEPITVEPFGDEHVAIDFGGYVAATRSPSAALRVSGDHWHLRRLEVRNVPQHPFEIVQGCVQVLGSHNVVERLDIHHCGGPGLEIKSTTGDPTPAGNNTIVNTDSHDNRDILQPGTDNSNADGFNHNGYGEGNVFLWNRAWRNADDGFDMFDTDSGLPVHSEAAVSLIGNWAMYNGSGVDRYNPSIPANGLGIKLGHGYGDHIVSRNVTWRNFRGGIVENRVGYTVDADGLEVPEVRGDGGLRVEHNTAAFEEGVDPKRHGFYFQLSGQYLSNNLATGTPGPSGTAHRNYGSDPGVNSWTVAVDDRPYEVTVDDFISVDDTGTMGPRQHDGSLPDLPFLRLKPTSPLVDSGVGMPGGHHVGDAPDLGAFEAPPAVG